MRYKKGAHDDFIIDDNTSVEHITLAFRLTAQEAEKTRRDIETDLASGRGQKSERDEWIITVAVFEEAAKKLYERVTTLEAGGEKAASLLKKTLESLKALQSRGINDEIWEPIHDRFFGPLPPLHENLKIVMATPELTHLKAA